MRFRSLRQLFKWALEEGEIASDPMERMRPPKVTEEPPAVLSDVELQKLLKACEGTDAVGRRDTAIVRTFIDTGARLSEVTGIKLGDVDLDAQTITVIGKGDRVRVLPIGAKTVAAIDRYMRARTRSAEEGLWLGEGGDDPFGRRADAPASRDQGRDRSPEPAQVPAHVRALLAPRGGKKATSRRSLAGARGRCCGGTARPRGPNAHVTRTHACRLVTGSNRLPLRIQEE